MYGMNNLSFLMNVLLWLFSFIFTLVRSYLGKLYLGFEISVIKCLTYLIVLDKLELRLGRKSDGYASIMGIREPGDPLLDVEAGRGRLAQVRLEVLGHFPHTQEVHEV